MVCLMEIMEVLLLVISALRYAERLVQRHQEVQRSIYPTHRHLQVITVMIIYHGMQCPHTTITSAARSNSWQPIS